MAGATGPGLTDRYWADFATEDQDRRTAHLGAVHKLMTTLILWGGLDPRPRLRETLNLLTNTDNRTDTIFK